MHKKKWSTSDLQKKKEFLRWLTDLRWSISHFLPVRSGFIISSSKPSIFITDGNFLQRKDFPMTHATYASRQPFDNAGYFDDGKSLSNWICPYRFVSCQCSWHHDRFGYWTSVSTSGARSNVTMWGLNKYDAIYFNKRFGICSVLFVYSQECIIPILLTTLSKCIEPCLFFKFRF